MCKFIQRDLVPCALPVAVRQLTRVIGHRMTPAERRNHHCIRSIGSSATLCYYSVIFHNMVDIIYAPAHVSHATRAWVSIEVCRGDRESFASRQINATWSSRSRVSNLPPKICHVESLVESAISRQKCHPASEIPNQKPNPKAIHTIVVLLVLAFNSIEELKLDSDNYLLCE